MLIIIICVNASCSSLSLFCHVLLVILKDLMSTTLFLFLIASSSLHLFPFLKSSLYSYLSLMTVLWDLIIILVKHIKLISVSSRSLNVLCKCYWKFLSFFVVIWLVSLLVLLLKHVLFLYVSASVTDCFLVH